MGAGSSDNRNKDSLISVVMPAYNVESYITDSIRSIQSQTYLNWELIIIDDASKDGTADIVRELSIGDSRITLHQLPVNQGAGFARNVGIKAAKGAFISFIDADDLWHPDKLQVQLDFMEAHQVSVCYSSYELIDDRGKSLNKVVRVLESLSFHRLLRANYIGNLTGIYNANILGKIYCPLIRKRQDWGLWLLAVRESGVAKGISMTLAKYRVRKHSISGNKIEMLRYNYKIYRQVLQYSTTHSLYRMLLFLWEQFFVKSRLKISKK